MCVSLHCFTLKTVVNPTKIKMNTESWILQEMIMSHNWWPKVGMAK